MQYSVIDMNEVFPFSAVLISLNIFMWNNNNSFQNASIKLYGSVFDSLSRKD